MIKRTKLIYRDLPLNICVEKFAEILHKSNNGYFIRNNPKGILYPLQLCKRFDATKDFKTL